MTCLGLGLGLGHLGEVWEAISGGCLSGFLEGAE